MLFRHLSKTTVLQSNQKVPLVLVLGGEHFLSDPLYPPQVIYK